jgi:hypothetical protein
MNWNSNWGDQTIIASIEPPINPKPTNPWDSWTQDQCLLHWQQLKEQLTKIKEDEMEFRKYIVSRAFPQADEGTNTLELGNGYGLKAVVKYNYKLMDNKVVREGLNRIAALGNRGTFIAERIVKWTPDFVKSEYNTISEEADNGSGEARAILKEINSFLIIEDAAPTLEIKEPKKKGKK